MHVGLLFDELNATVDGSVGYVLSMILDGVADTIDALIEYLLDSAFALID